MKKQTSIVTLLVIIGAVLLSGCMSQSDNGNEVAPIDDGTKTIDPVSGEITRAGEVAGEEVSDDNSKDASKETEINDELKKYELVEEILYATGTVDKDEIVTIHVENHHFSKLDFPDLKIDIGFSLEDKNGTKIRIHAFKCIGRGEETIPKKSTRSIEIDVWDLPEMIDVRGHYNIKDVEIEKISLDRGEIIEARIVTKEKVLEEVGYISTTYPINNIPPILKFRDYMKKTECGRLETIQVLDLRYEDNRFKFCLKDPKGSQGFRIIIVCNDCEIEHLYPVNIPKDKEICFETRAIVREKLYKNPESVFIRITP